MGPEIIHHPLVRADGSATYSSSLFSVTAAVNGPIEVQRRDELPEEAAIEVNIRPSSGVGGPRERWLESVVSGVLRSVLLVHMNPRTLIQITLQVTKEPSLKLRRSVKDIAALPSLLHASFLAVADGGLPLATTMSASLVAVAETGETVLEPSEKELAKSRSAHAFSFNTHGDLLLDESAGEFDSQMWESVCQLAAKACADTVQRGEDEAMGNGAAEKLPWLRLELEDRAREGSAWRETT
ncbi:Hypothetical protein R9X50_00542600 [Acrodontium crateriforme]|uniref:Exoribonuclease phosphorolytic domain-containing protein n=1 Tax=Acrodontium crateriforme TaxID=150365 RepID=A0AAQ3M9K4_9PEZI|nr:Hypothetical protein R9X50_00542600 [Acrodontium crateriforme]